MGDICNTINNKNVFLKRWKLTKGPGSLDSTTHWGFKVFTPGWVKQSGGREEKFLDSLTWELHKLWYQNPLTKRWCGLQLDWENMKVVLPREGLMGWGALECLDRFMQITCVSFTWMSYGHGYSGWAMLTLPNVVKPKLCQNGGYS